MARPSVPTSLMKRARIAYETARLRSAVIRAWPIPVAALLAYRLGSPAAHVACLALPLAVAAIALLWHGRVPGRAVEPGLLAGAAPLVLPGLAMDCATACAASCATWCAISCAIGGIVAGAVVVFLAPKGRGWTFGLTAAAIAAATGAMGCIMAGATGVTGMLVGLAVGTVPMFVLVPRHS